MSFRNLLSSISDQFRPQRFLITSKLYRMTKETKTRLSSDSPSVVVLLLLFVSLLLNLRAFTYVTTSWRSHSGLSVFDAVEPSDICASVLNNGELINLKGRKYFAINLSGDYFGKNNLTSDRNPYASTYKFAAELHQTLKLWAQPCFY